LSFPSPEKDQYRAEINVSQKIFDGGVSSARKDLLEKETAVDQKEVESEHYRIKEVINKYYFAILTLRKEMAIAGTVNADLSEQRKMLQSGLEHGAVRESAVRELETRIIQSEQKVISIQMELCSAFEALEEIAGIAIDTSAVLVIPEFSCPYPREESPRYKRPELEVLDLQMERAHSAEKLIFRESLPRIHGFATLGYGRPGLNMMSDQFDSYYMAGVVLSWNPFDWGDNSRERDITRINGRIIKRSRESLMRNISAQLRDAGRSIEKYDRMLEKDRQILRLRERIAEVKRSRFRNGDITADDYISEINRLEQARLNMEKDRIGLQKAKVDYLMIKGEL
jgi:outer membrane protein TolC